MKGIILLPNGQFTPLKNYSVQNFVSAAVNLVLIITAILFLFSIFGAGFKFMLSGGNKEKMKEAGRQILNAFVGIVLVFSTWAIMGALSDFFGVNLLQFQIPAF